MKWIKTKHPGVLAQHSDLCPAVSGRRCRCEARFRGEVWDRTLKRPVKGPLFDNADEAAGWRVDYKRGAVRAPTPAVDRITFKDLAERFLDGAGRGDIAAKGDDAYSERTLYSYRSVLEKHVHPRYGGANAASLKPEHWQRMVDELRASGLKRNTINNVLMPVRAIYRWACSPTRRILPANTVLGLDMPARDEVARMRVAPPDEAERLLSALPLGDRVAYGLAFYAGLRRREIRPCTWDWIDFDGGVIHVRESKTEAGTNRRVPLVSQLRALLLEAHLAQGRPEDWRLVVPGERSGGQFSADALLKRCAKLWEGEGLEPIGLHDARHTYASYLIAAAVNAKAISTYMGHTSIQITFDRYGHLMPGNEAEAAGLLDDYLRRAAG